MLKRLQRAALLAAAALLWLVATPAAVQAGGVSVYFGAGYGHGGYDRHGHGAWRYRHRGHGYRGHGHRGYGRHGYGLRGHGHARRWYRAPLWYDAAPVYQAPVVQYLPDLQVTRPAAPVSVPLLEYRSLRGQGRAQMHSERLACEREAVQRNPGVGRVTRSVVSVPVPTHGYRAAGPGPLGAAAGGAALGALGGAIAGSAGSGAAIGAAAGAAAWLLGITEPVARPVYQQRVVETVEPGAPDPMALREALVRCMSARGYAVG